MSKLKESLMQVLKKDTRLWDESELNETKLKDFIDKLDETLLGLLIESKVIEENFFIRLKRKDKDIYVLKQNEIKFYIDENKLDNSYTQYQNKIGLRVGNKLLSERDEVVLDWPFKDCVLEGGMTKEDQKRNEIFFNEVLAKDEIDRLEDPKALVNWKRYTAKGAEKVKELKRDKDGTIRENLIIKGNNLLALHSLKEQFTGKVKLIYIDPPYNRKADSFYNDNFKRSSWLTFMRNRLEVAKELLTNDGAIFIQIDDEQQAYLKALCDEIFKEENYEITLYIQVRYGEKTLSEKNDYQKLIEQILVYKKPGYKPTKETEEYSLKKFEWKITELSEGKRVKLGNREVLIYKSGEYKIEKVPFSISALKETWASGTVLKANASGKFFGDHIAPRVAEDGLGVLYKAIGIGEDGLGYRYFTGPKKEGATKGKFYSGVPLSRVDDLKNGSSLKEKVILNFYNLADSFGNCRLEGGVELRSGKKPEELLKMIIRLALKPGDIVLDYFLGTGVTAAVAHKLGFQYIGVEQLDYGKDDSVVRLKNVINGDSTGISEEINWQGGGDFVYVELAKWNEEAKEKMKKAKSLSELEKLFYDLYEQYFLNYNVKTKEFKEKIIKEEGFGKLSLKDQRKLFIEMLDMNQMYVNFSERADNKYSLSKKDIALSEEFYNTKK